MKGTVSERVYKGRSNYGFVTGEDGEQYFFYAGDVKNCASKNLVRGNIVEFDGNINEDGKKRANNIRKTGHGRRHPFVKNLEQMIYFFDHCMGDQNEIKWYKRDAEAMIRYFSEVEDYEWCKSPKQVFGGDYDADKDMRKVDHI